MAVAGIEQVLPHVPRLRRYARLLTGDAARADDLVQDTLERACRKWALWSTAGGPLHGWLLTLMHNLHANQRRDGRHDEGHVELTAEREPRHEPHLATGMRMDLERALQALSPASREVILLVCVEELSYEEAARTLGVPVGTVMSRLSRAREAMRLAMQEPVAAPRPVLKVVR